MKEGTAAKVRAAGGEIFAVTSEPQVLASRAQQEWELDFESVGDPHQEIRAVCGERGWLELFVNPSMEFLVASSAGADFTPQHPKGFLQPGVLAVSAQGRVLYRWRGVPTHKNLGGAVERPTAQHVWSQVEHALERTDSAGDAPLDVDPPLDSRGIPWPLFVPLLVANGWFVSPQGFSERRGLTALQRLKRAALRLLGFAAAWVAAFVWLPTPLVAIALLGWIAWITPKVRWLNREFQQVEAG